MRVGDGIDKLVVFIGRSTPTGQFMPHGTGFLVGFNEDGMSFQSVVTARHVIDSIENTDEILLRINTRAGAVRTVPTDRKFWFSRDDKIDLAFCPMRLSVEIFDILHVNTNVILNDETIAKYQIGLGEDVCICGMYLSRIGEARNLPIVRIGTLAAMPSEMVRTSYGYHHVYLIEARSTGVLSGSPVFLQTPPIKMINSKVQWSWGVPDTIFVGMVLGYNKLAFPPELIEFLPPDMKDEDDRQDDERERAVPLNTGVAIVLPAAYIIEAVNNPQIMAMRKAITRDALAKSGYVPSAAPSINPSDAVSGPEADKPAHR